MIKGSLGQKLVVMVMVDKCFVLDLNQFNLKPYASLVDVSCLWHKRLGHVNYRSLSLLNKLDLVESISKVDDKGAICEVCQLGKQTRLQFPIKKTWRAHDKLQLVHIDVSGLMKTSSLSDSRFFVLFIDDCTWF